jgi:RNA polymerase sigma-70 factor, ECF subfamily
MEAEQNYTPSSRRDESQATYPLPKGEASGTALSLSNRSSLTPLLASATNGEDSAREQLLALYRPYLRLAAAHRIPKLFQQRMDASDLVQLTMLDAVRGLPEFRGQTEPEFTAWIMRLLERNLLQTIRDNTLGKRDARLERKWADDSGSAVLMWATLAGDGSSPTSGVLRGEAALYLAAALEQLPGDQRMAVEMRYIGQMPFQAIADAMERSLGSVAGLIRRGVETLQAHLPAEFGDLS